MPNLNQTQGCYELLPGNKRKIENNYIYIIYKCMKLETIRLCHLCV